MQGPNTIIIQKSQWPSNVEVEECERVEGDYLIRFARARDVGVGERITRFFEDLFTGTKKAKGFLCDRERLPAHVFVGGRSLVVKQDKAHPAGAEDKKIDIGLRDPAGSSAERLAPDDPPSQPTAGATASRARMSGDLKAQFAANGLGRHEHGLTAFLDCTRHSRTLRTTDAIRLMAFADQFAHLEDELHADVAATVRDQLKTLESRIRQDLGSTAQGSFRDFAFKVLKGPGLPPPPPPLDLSNEGAPVLPPPPPPIHLSHAGLSNRPPPPPPPNRSTTVSPTPTPPPPSPPAPPALKVGPAARAATAETSESSFAGELATFRGRLKPVPESRQEKPVATPSDPLAAALLARMGKMSKDLASKDSDASQDDSFWDDDPPANTGNPGNRANPT